MINVRNRLLKIDSKRKNCANVPKIKKLSVEIRAFFTSAKRGRVRRAATGGNSYLWKAVIFETEIEHTQYIVNDSVAI